MSNISRFLNIDSILKSGERKNPTTALYSKITKPEKYFDKKKILKTAKVKKRSHAFKGYACSYNVETLNSFNF